MMVHWAMAEPMLWVGDLGSDVRSDDLRTAFLQFGELRDAKVVADPVSGASRVRLNDSAGELERAHRLAHPRCVTRAPSAWSRGTGS